MGGVRVSRLRRVSALLWARLGYAVGCLTAAAGVGIEFGPGWALTVGGAVGAASCLLLVDVDAKRPARGGDGR
ncbi:hypothetical protein [Micromonospora parva]|uniref:hypothetical protein n=1 Tax=Micromonospora parva TaxID=1464048 RepID=UPI0036613CB2